MKTPFDDNDIPVLTDVIRANDSEPAPVAATISAEEQWGQWQHEIHENVLQNLLGKVSPELSQQVEEHVSVAMMHLSDQITRQIKIALEEALRDTVSRAVAEEMNKFRN
jgi:hypothetical protein